MRTSWRCGAWPDDAARLQLAELTGDAVADLVAALAGGRPDVNLLRLADGAAGNPLYVTELVAALARGSSLTVTEAGDRRAGGRFRAGLAVRGHSGPPRLRGRPGARRAAGGGPARHGLRGPRPGDRAGPQRDGPDPGGRRGVVPPACWPSPARPRVPASADPHGAVRRHADAGARRLAPRRGSSPGQGGRAGGPGGPADTAGRRRTWRRGRADGRVDARLADRYRRLARRPGARGRGGTPCPGSRPFAGWLGPARLAGQPTRRRPVSRG